MFQTVDTDLSSADERRLFQKEGQDTKFQTVDTDLSSADLLVAWLCLHLWDCFRPLTRIYLLLTSLLVKLWAKGVTRFRPLTRIYLLLTLDRDRCSA